MTLTPEQRAFAGEVQAIKEKAGRLGLYRTMQALEPATQEVGWELAIIEDPSQVELRDKYNTERP